MKTLIIGLGNPILGDDGIGWRVAEEIAKRFSSPSSPLPAREEGTIEVDTAALGGLSLMERLIGYDYVILIDSLNTGQHPQGAVVTFTLDSLDDLTYGHSASAHDVSLKTALRMGRQMGIDLPDDADVHVVAVEAQHVYDFKEELTPAIAAAAPVAVQQVLDLLKEVNGI